MFKLVVTNAGLQANRLQTAWENHHISFDTHKQEVKANFDIAFYYSDHKSIQTLKGEFSG